MLPFNGKNTLIKLSLKWNPMKYRNVAHGSRSNGYPEHVLGRRRHREGLRPFAPSDNSWYKGPVPGDTPRDLRLSKRTPQQSCAGH